jgi:hypothetical protein
LNIFGAIKAIGNDPSKKFSNGWNTIESGDDSYEIKISDKEGKTITALLSSYSEVKDNRR